MVEKEELQHLLIDGRAWSSVSQYVAHQHDTRQPALHRAMLHKFCQNVHLQQNLFDLGKALVALAEHGGDVPPDCVRWLYSELRPHTDEQVHHMLFAKETGFMQDAVRAAVAAMFRRSQPFLGATRAHTLARMLLQKLTLQCTFDAQQEALLQSFMLE